MEIKRTETREIHDHYLCDVCGHRIYGDCPKIQDMCDRWEACDFCDDCYLKVKEFIISIGGKFNKIP